MSDPNILLSADESNPHKRLEVSEGFEASDVDSEQEKKCTHCFPNKLHQEINEDESEKKNGPQVLDGKDVISLDPLAGQEELALQWRVEEDMELQQWSDGSIYRGNITMNMKLGVGEFRWANGESYIGEFYKDHHHGKGIYYWPDGCKFTGFFYLSRKEGYGTMTFPDGKSYQGLYKSDVRYGPGFETYSDGCQDVGIWKGQQLFRLCTVVPGSISTLSYPQFSQPQKTNKRCVSEDHDSVTEKGKTEDPFLFRYKLLLLEDRFTLPEKIYSYSSDTDHLPITPTEYLEFNQHFYRDKDQQEVCSHVTFDNVQPNSGMKKIYLHINEHRHSPQHLKWGISIMNGDRYKFGPIGPRERVAEQLIVAAGLGDYDAICTILRHDLAHVDVSDKCGLTALQAAAVNGHNNIINLLLDNGADVNKSNDEGLSALSLCLMLFYSSKSFWPNVAERNLPFSKEESSDFTLGIHGSEGNAAHEKDVKHYDQMPTVLETCPDVPYSETSPGQEALDSTSDPHKDKNLRSTINLLLLRGADPDMCSIPMHPLFFAVRAADANTVQLLLECGASTDVRLSTADGSLTPLHIAAALPVAEGTRITEILLFAASDPNASAEDGDYVYDPDRVMTKEGVDQLLSLAHTLHHLPSAGQPLMCHDLKSFQEGDSPGTVLGFPMKGCHDSGLPLYNYYEKSPHVPEEGGRTPLHVACEREDNYKLAKDTISLLLAHNAKVNTLWSGHSPLSLAIASGNDMAVKELLANGADPNLPLSRGVGSALCAAVNTAYEKHRTLAARIALVDRLIKSGANILMPILIGEGKRTALGTATDYAYYKYFQDKKIAHTPYHALSPEERDIFNARKQLLEHLGELTREAVKAKEKKEWANDRIIRSSSTHRDPERKVTTHEALGEEHMYAPKKTFFKHCYQCGRSVGVKLTPCLRCYSVYTCSKQCKHKSWTERHKDECLQLSGKLSSKMTPARGDWSSPTKSPHADREPSSHGPRPHTGGHSVAATTENYSFN